MRGLLWVLGLFALAVGISLAANVNDGYLLLVVPPYRGEISLNLAIIVLFLVFFLIYALVRAAALSLSLPQKVSEFRERRAREKALALLGDSVRLLFEGRYERALKSAAKAHVATPAAEMPAALVAARAAFALGDFAHMREWLDRAVQGKKGQDARAASLMLEAEMLLEASRFAEAAEVLARLRESSRENAAALRLELRAQQGCGNQGEVERIVRRLKKHGVAAELPVTVAPVDITGESAAR